MPELTPNVGGNCASPSLLAVTGQLPWPLDTGGHLRSFYLLRSIAQHFRVRLVVPVRSGQEQGMAALKEHGIDVQPVPVERRVWREGLKAAASAVTRRPYVMYRRHEHRAVRAAVSRELVRQRPDVIYLDHLDSAVYWSENWRTPVALDLHNVYSTLVRRAAEERSGLSSIYLQREALLLEAMERRAVRFASLVSAVSNQEVNHFQQLGARSVQMVPNGVDCQAYDTLPLGRRGGTPLLLYVGAMSWAPNVSAACWLAKDLMGRLREHFPGARLRIVGRDPTSQVRALAEEPGVEVTGCVPSMIPHLREADLLVVPLEAGGGTRLKILEAFAAGLPVVSTAVGCEGLPVEHKEHLWIAERTEFDDAVKTLLQDSSLGQGIARRARDLVQQRFDWRAVGEAACRALLAMNRAGRN